MKSLTQISRPLTLAGLFLGSTVVALGAPVASIGDNTSLFINSAAGVEYNTNIFRSSTNSQSDTSLFVRPGIELAYGGQGAPAVAQFTAAWEIRRHDRFSQLDGEYARLNFNTTYDSGITLFTGWASFNEYGTSSRVDDPSDTLIELVPVIADRSEGRIGGNARYRVSDRLALGAGAEYWSRTYQNSPTGRTLVNLDRYDVPLRLFYNIAPRLDGVFGYRFREVRVGDSPAGFSPPNYRDHYVFVGFDGQVLNPLWNASFDIGYQERNYRNSGHSSVGSLSTNGRLTYAADANRSYYLLLNRDFHVSPVGAETFTKNQITVGANYRMNEMWSFIGAINYAMTRYETSNREEDLFFLLGGVTYSPNEYVSVSARVRLTTVDGSGAYATDYESEFFSISASVRY